MAFTTARVADQGGVKIGTSVTTGKWFQRYRGRATGLVFFVETIGVITLAPLTHLVISQLGWRPAWLTLAGLMFLLGVLTCALWVRRQPEGMGLASTGINTLAPIMWARCYGRGSLGAIQGVGRAAQVVGFCNRTTGVGTSPTTPPEATERPSWSWPAWRCWLMQRGLMAASRTWSGSTWSTPH